MTSVDLSLRRPEIGYARLVVARNSPHQSQGMDIISVITLGQQANVPLMWCPSELSYGLEPHDQIYTAGHRDVAGEVPPGRRGVYPGWR